MSWAVQVDDVLSGHFVEVAGLGTFERACRVHDQHAPFDEHTLLSLHGLRRVPHARLSVSDGADLLACAVLTEALECWYIELAVLPSHRGRGLARALAQAATEHVASHGGGLVRSWVHEVSPGVAALARHAQVQRTLLVLRRDLLATPPGPGASTRPLGAAERGAWLALSNAAFAGHPENGGWTRRDLDWRMDLPWTSLARWPVVADGDRLLAGVWTKVEKGSTSGELYVVAVHPESQGRGLGQVVVAAALRQLAGAGCRTAHLYVDADNAAAVSLYRGFGFLDGEVHRCLQVTVPRPGTVPGRSPRDGVPAMTRPDRTAEHPVHPRPGH